MRTFIFGVAAGALVAAAVIRFAPPRYRPFGSDSPPPASVTATPAAICGRDTFNVNVNVDRLFPGSSGGDPLEATLEKRQDAFADGLHDRLIRAGLRHELACPVMLDIFGMATENQQGVWLVADVAEIPESLFACLWRFPIPPVCPPNGRGLWSISETPSSETVALCVCQPWFYI